MIRARWKLESRLRSAMAGECNGGGLTVGSTSESKDGGGVAKREKCSSDATFRLICWKEIQAMPSFENVLQDARQLTDAERLQLIHALWDDMPADADLPLHPDWEPELERRVAAIRNGTAKMTAWETIRAEALARLGDGSSH